MQTKVFKFSLQGRQVTGVRIIFEKFVFGEMVEETISRDEFVN